MLFRLNTQCDERFLSCKTKNRLDKKEEKVKKTATEHDASNGIDSMHRIKILLASQVNRQDNSVHVLLEYKK
jgi:hypothetical protein